MEPDKSHTLSQQGFIYSAEGCSSGPRPEDLMRGEHEGDIPQAGQRVAARANDQGMNLEPIKLTKREMFDILTEQARLIGPKKRPLDLTTEDRTRIVLKTLFPNEIAENFDSKNKTVVETVTKFISKCETMYKASKRNLQLFYKKNRSWLDTKFAIPHMSFPNVTTTSQETLIVSVSSTSTSKLKEPQPSILTLKVIEPDLSSSQEMLNLMEPELSSSQKMLLEPEASTSQEMFLESKPSTSQTSKTYDSLSSRQQRRIRKRLEEELEGQPHSKIIKAISKVVTDHTGEKLSSGSARKLEFVINECLKSPTRPKKIASIIPPKVEPKPFSPEEALSMMIERKFTVDDYISMQRELKERGFPAYPSHYRVQFAKKMCYPDEQLHVTEREASVSLHSLLLHTIRRIIKACDTKITEYFNQNYKDIVYCIFEGSWGFDGSTGQSVYKQNFKNGNDKDENCLFATTFIPLYLKTNDGFVLWSNPSPQSFRFCRPVKIQYREETKELILEEKTRVEDEIKKLSPLYAETLSGQSIIAEPKLHLTIIDGKVFNIITGTSSQLRCACCGASPSDFNNLNLIKNRPLNPEALRHGLSPLHAWIRIFEFLLHLGYKNDPAVMKWRVSKNSFEAITVESRKKYIQSEIRSRMGLIVDVVRPNSGTTNDGNTARTALSDKYRESFSEILGLEPWLAEDLHTILVVLSIYSLLEVTMDNVRYFPPDSNFEFEEVELTSDEILIISDTEDVA
ncbi:hypothetical protein B5X24_HaOG212451 [Helicoverpa armigera]|nr:hypothetical protein B5X24_HaOG212451 [Helicoverpa armigera]